MMNSRKLLFVGYFVVLALVFTACSSDDDPTVPTSNTVKETIGTGGGTIEMADKVALNIPADALDGNINFTLADAGTSHEDMVAVRSLCSSVYSIGPSGTTFSDPVQLVLNYDEADLDGVAEASIIIYTDNGSGWIALPTEVDQINNVATAQITHLSDFAVTAPMGTPAQGVYGVFEILRMVTYQGEGSNNTHVDLIAARFDSVVNQCSVVQPMYPDSVYCSSYPMSYDGLLRGYIDENDDVDFLNLGETYTFNVVGSTDVPALQRSITMVSHEPAITNIDNFDAVSSQGFTVLWNDNSGGTVTLELALAKEVLLSKEVPDNGSYTFTAADLAGMSSGTYVLHLAHFQKIVLDDVTGYDPNSYIMALSSDIKLISLNAQAGFIGSAGGTVMLGDDGQLVIPADALDEPVLFEAEISTSPLEAPQGYQLLTPVYSIEPSGTTFDGGASIKFDYSEGDLGGALEDDIVIFVNEGSGWEELPSTVYDSYNYVEASINHLSDFVAAVPEPIVTEGVYVVLDVSSIFTYWAMPPVARTDFLGARFDDTVADDAVNPLQATSVSFGTWDLVYDNDSYEYVDFVESSFLTTGSTYNFVVTENTAVPNLNVPVEVMDIEPYVTNLTAMHNVPLSGYTLEWHGAKVGTNVRILVISPGGAGLDLLVPNNGSYTFTGTQFEALAAGSGSINLFWEQEIPLVANGYDSNSHILLSTTNNNSVVFTDELVIDNVLLASSPNLVIPDITVNGHNNPVTDTINVTATGVVDSVRVYLNIDHGYSSDLTLKLTSPDGTELKVFWIGEGGEPAVDPVGWYPDDFTPKEDLNLYDGENVNGTWTITAKDNSYDQGGRLLEWRLQVFYAH